MGLLIAWLVGAGVGLAIVVLFLWAVWPKAPKGMKSVKCPRCNAYQNIPETDQTFECWQCHRKSPAAGNATAPVG